MGADQEEPEGLELLAGHVPADTLATNQQALHLSLLQVCLACCSPPCSTSVHAPPSVSTCSRPCMQRLPADPSYVHTYMCMMALCQRYAPCACLCM